MHSATVVDTQSGDFSRISRITPTIKLIMEDNSIIECDYLIVSDGVFSSTKLLVTKRNVKQKYSNLIAVRGTIDKKNIRDIDYNNISLLLGSDLHSVIYPVNKSNEFNFITILKKNLTKNELGNNLFFNAIDGITLFLPHEIIT